MKIKSCILGAKSICFCVLIVSAALLYGETITFNSKSISESFYDSANSRKLSYSLEPMFGLRFGHLGEYVYFNNRLTGDDYILSYLEWEMKPAFFTGAKINRSWRKFTLNFYYKYFLPLVKCGDMEDNDWLQDYGYGTGNTSIQTNYSCHSNKLNYSYALGSEFSILFYKNSIIEIKNFLAFDFESISFTGFDGYCIYGNSATNSYFINEPPAYHPYNSRESHSQALSGDVIKYVRNDLYTWIGMSIAFCPWKSTLGLAGYISPFTFVYAYDDHIIRERKTKSLMYDSFCAYKFSFFYMYQISERMSLKADCTMLGTKVIRGERYQKEPGSDLFQRINIKNLDGADTKFVEYTLSAIWKF